MRIIKPLPGTLPMPERNIVGDWPMNEGSGNKIFDLSGNNYVGTLHNDLNWEAGKYGHSINSKTSENGITTTVNPSAWDSGFTVVFELYSLDLSTAVDYVVDNTNGNVGFGIRSGNTSTTFEFFTYPGPCLLSTANFWSTGERVHISCVHGNGANSVYKNGIFFDSENTNFSLGLADTATNLAIMAEHDGANGLIAKIEYIYFYNRILSPFEIALIYREAFYRYPENRVFPFAA